MYKIVLHRAGRSFTLSSGIVDEIKAAQAAIEIKDLMARQGDSITIEKD